MTDTAESTRPINSLLDAWVKALGEIGLTNPRSEHVPDTITVYDPDGTEVIMGKPTRDLTAPDGDHSHLLQRNTMQAYQRIENVAHVVTISTLGEPTMETTMYGEPAEPLTTAAAIIALCIAGHVTRPGDPT